VKKDADLQGAFLVSAGLDTVVTYLEWPRNRPWTGCPACWRRRAR